MYILYVCHVDLQVVASSVWPVRPSIQQLKPHNITAYSIVLSGSQFKLPQVHGFMKH